MKTKTQLTTIVDPIVIRMDNCYDIIKWEKALILRCIEDNPSSDREEIAKLLNMNVRTLYRKLKDFDIQAKFGKYYQ